MKKLQQMIIYERVREAASEGQSLAQIKAMKPALDYDPLYSVPAWTGEAMVEAIFDEVRGQTRD